MRCSQTGKLALALLASFLCCGNIALAEDTSTPEDKPTPASTPPKPNPLAAKASKTAPLDRSGKPRVGKASYYGREFHGKKMADGTRMNPRANIAASKTLPLGTKAKVTNLENGKSEVVEIRDRGPYVAGRIVDLSPKVAERLDIVPEGVAPVKVTPIEVPLPDGSVKPGAAANDTVSTDMKPEPTP